jgi:hypothetical protein
MRLDPSTLILAGLAITFAIVAYFKDPSLPLLGVTPGGPMVSVPFMVVAANSGAALPALVAYMTSWSLFGVQRIIAWEAPLMVIPSLAFPVVAGWLVATFYHE